MLFFFLDCRIRIASHLAKSKKKKHVHASLRKKPILTTERAANFTSLEREGKEEKKKMEQKQMSIDRSVLTLSQAFSELRDEQPKETIIKAKKERCVFFFSTSAFSETASLFRYCSCTHTQKKKKTLSVKKKK